MAFALAGHVEPVQRRLGKIQVAVFNQWFSYLNVEGRSAGLVKPLTCYGKLNAIQISLDPTRWTEVIAKGLKSRRITLPD